MERGAGITRHHLTGHLHSRNDCQHIRAEIQTAQRST